MSEAGVVIGLDLGTSGVKAVAVDATGHAVCSAQRAVSLMTDDAGKAEQSVEDVWRAAEEVLVEIDRACSGAPLKRGTPLAICVSGAMHSVVGLDDAGNVTGHATTWADQRCAPIAAAMRDTFDVDALYRRTGCPFSALYHPARLRWWISRQTNAVRFVAIKDVVIHRLTGVWCTDAGSASTTGLMDTRTWQWDEQALALAGVKAEQLPRIVAPTQIIGRVSIGGAYEGVPVIAGASDGALANVGAAGFDSSRTVVTLGTSGAVRRIERQPGFDTPPGRRTWCYVVERDRWLRGSAINSGGIAVQHAIATAYGVGGDEQTIMRAHHEAGQVGVGSDGLRVLPFVTGERGLIWPAEARWTVIGQSAHHTPGHWVRATMEGVAYCIAGLWEAMGNSSQTEDHHDAAANHADEACRSPALLTGGVVRSATWRQIVADVLGVAMEPVEAADASAVGAAIMGWRALGVTVHRPMSVSHVVRPNMERHEKYVELIGQFRASCRERSWIVS